ncbi:MAG: TRAP transporter small permease subunit [Gammaproteobacteria bacterium]
MPDITFILPHWIYWGGLVAVPVFFILAARRCGGKTRQERLSLPLAYFFWLVSGFMGIHRLYLKSALAAVFIALFVGVILCNYGAKQTRNEHSIVKNEAFNAGYDLTVALEEDAAEDVISALRRDVKAKTESKEQLAQKLENWHKGAGAVALVIFLLLIFDGLMMPRLIARQNNRHKPRTAHPPPPEEAGKKECAKDKNGGGDLSMFERAVGGINKMTGEFAAYWTVAAVFVFYYEVIARYVFNSPTVWAHESMFLMFGMQYLLAGGFCLRENAHVRVDVLYMHLPPKWKAVANMATSMFFFVFAAVLMITGWIFFRDSYSIGQVSHTEWQIAHWPIKFALPLGGLLLLLQGAALFAADIRALRRG